MNNSWVYFGKGLIPNSKLLHFSRDIVVDPLPVFSMAPPSGFFGAYLHHVCFFDKIHKYLASCVMLQVQGHGSLIAVDARKVPRNLLSGFPLFPFPFRSPRSGVILKTVNISPQR